MPIFTRKALRAASSKTPIAGNLATSLSIRYNLALQDVLFGESLKTSRIDLGTVYNFVLSAKLLNLIDDEGITESNLKNLAKAFTRVDAGKSFRLDADCAEAFREIIPAFDMLAKSLSARDYMKVCNAMIEEPK